MLLHFHKDSLVCYRKPPQQGEKPNNKQVPTSQDVRRKGKTIVPNYGRDSHLPKCHHPNSERGASDQDYRRKGKAPEQGCQHPPKSRTKTKCRFGPRPRQERPPNRPTSHRFFRSWDTSSNQLPVDEDQNHLEIPCPHLPARVTLEHAALLSRTPFDHYKAQASPAPRDNPFIFLQRRLGILEAEFEAQIEQEVDDLLKEQEIERNNARVESPPRIEEAPPPRPDERPISKDECITMLSRLEFTTGSLLGMWRWAANLGEARFNFELGWDAESLELLNAYN